MEMLDRRPSTPNSLRSGSEREMPPTNKALPCKCAPMHRQCPYSCPQATFAKSNTESESSFESESSSESPTKISLEEFKETSAAGCLTCAVIFEGVSKNLCKLDLKNEFEGLLKGEEGVW